MQASEGAGYPALLLVSAAGLAIAVAGFLLVALTQTVWAFVVAVLSELLALAMLYAAIFAAFSERPPTGRAPGSGS